MENADSKRIKQKIVNTYVPLKNLIFEDNRKEINITNNFTNYSHVLASVELIIHSFIIANPETKDEEILSALKRIKENPLHEFSLSEEDVLEFAVIYGISRGLQQKRLAINEVRALLDWIIHEVEGRLETCESYIAWIKTFFNDNKKYKAKNGRNF